MCKNNISDSPIYCQHANESPQKMICDCEENCYCKIHGNCSFALLGNGFKLDKSYHKDIFDRYLSSCISFSSEIEKMIKG